MSKNRKLPQVVIDAVRTQFPQLSITISPSEDPFLIIEPMWEEFERVEISENEGELIVVWGRFTHSHIACYDQDLDNAKAIDNIVEQFLITLSDVLNDKIVFWGSHKGKGGFYHVDHELSFPFPDVDRSGFFWSGTAHTAT